MSGVGISQWAALKRQKDGRNGKEGQPAPLCRASWSTAIHLYMGMMAILVNGLQPF